MFILNDKETGLVSGGRDLGREIAQGAGTLAGAAITKHPSGAVAGNIIGGQVYDITDKPVPAGMNPSGIPSGNPWGLPRGMDSRCAEREFSMNNTMMCN